MREQEKETMDMRAFGKIGVAVLAMTVTVSSVANGADELRVVVPDKATAAETRAAGVLSRYLGEILGRKIETVTDVVPGRKDEIVVGKSSRLAELGVTIDFAALGEDGFTIRTAGDSLVIAGGSGKGTVYGAYTFLEDHLGCRMYTPGATVIPRREKIEFPDLDVTQVPGLRFREVYYRHAGNADYREWHKLKPADSGGVHTFQWLIGPKEYFEKHPEYFSEINGQRVPNKQLCLTNPDVFKIMVEKLKKDMAKNPKKKAWSVSQNDNHGFCACKRCRMIDAREESHAGSLIAFVNRVAAEFPDKIISTLAYQYSRAAPKNRRLAKNVKIVLCSIECDRSRPIATDPSSKSFRRDVKDWGRISNDILIWDYVIQFSNLVSPFPNLRVLQPNIRYFVDNNCTAMFQQGSREAGGEFFELRAYLIAKIMWDPEVDLDAVMTDFLQGYYGAAGKQIRSYIDLMHDELEKSGVRLGIYDTPCTPVKGHLSPALMDQYSEFFAKAEKAVADSPELLERVCVARLPLDYAVLEQAKKPADGPRGMFSLAEDGVRTVRPEIRKTLERFTSLCIRQGVTLLKEWTMPPKEYHANYLRLLEQGTRRLTLKAAVEPGAVKSGLDFRVYLQSNTDWLKLPDFAKLTPKTLGDAKGFDISRARHTERFAMVFDGFVNAPAKGIYTFYTNSDDGSRLEIGDEVIVDNDGQHAMVEESGRVALRKGLHPIRVSFFECGGAEGLVVSWSGPGFEKQPIPAAALRRLSR